MQDQGRVTWEDLKKGIGQPFELKEIGITVRGTLSRVWVVNGEVNEVRLLISDPVRSADLKLGSWSPCKGEFAIPLDTAINRVNGHLVFEVFCGGNGGKLVKREFKVIAAP